MECVDGRMDTLSCLEMPTHAFSLKCYREEKGLVSRRVIEKTTLTYREKETEINILHILDIKYVGELYATEITTLNG